MRAWLRFLRRLRHDRRGGIAVMSALLGVPLIAMSGIAVDSARAWLLQSRLYTALDAAALAGARNIALPSGQRDAEIAGMFWTNIGWRDGAAALPTPAIGSGWRGFLDATTTLDPPVRVDDNVIRLSARADLPTTLTWRLLGVRTLTVRAEVEARRADLGLEIALVLDVTGSMDTNCGTPSDRTGANCGVTTVPTSPEEVVTGLSSNIDLLRLAAADLVNTLYGERETVPNLWVSVVPYTTTVNLGPTRTRWLRAEDAATLAANFSPTTWRGCVEARIGYPGAPADGDANDDPPAVTPFRPFLYRSTLGVYTLTGARVPGDNDWARRLWNAAAPAASDAITEDFQYWRGNYQVGPNVGCPQTPVLPLTAEKSTVLATIQSLRPTFRGGTMANLGLQAGWFTLSPRWRGAEGWDLGGPPPGQRTALPLDYGTLYMNKAVVLMTDGTNQWFDAPHGFPGACSEGASATSFPTVGSRLAPGAAQPIRPVACPPGGRVGEVQVAAGGPPITNNADYTGYGRLQERRLGAGIGTNAQAATEIGTRMANLCTRIKAQGITIYTVVLDTGAAGLPAATRTLYERCATDPDNYFYVSVPTQLRSAFVQIGTQLANLRILR